MCLDFLDGEWKNFLVFVNHLLGWLWLETF